MNFQVILPKSVQKQLDRLAVTLPAAFSTVCANWKTILVQPA